MPKYQLTIAPGYVEDWTYLEAVRELFQNALDNQTIDPDNEMYFEYDGDVLRIGNKTSILQVDSLLIGASTKRNNENTIGKHGEGYKVALVILGREGKGVTFYNYGNRQVWTTRFIKSRKWNGALIPEVDVNKKYTWQSIPCHSLVIEVEGITPAEYEKIVESNLHLQGELDRIETSNNMGYILTDPKYKGKVYVNGLFVCENAQFGYGYSIAPKYIKLDRDRKLIDTVNLAWVTSQMWRYSGQEELVAKLLLQDVWDVKYVKERRDYLSPVRDKEAEIDRRITETLKEEFIAEHGERAIPVSDNKELQRVTRSGAGMKPAMVSSGVSAYLKTDETLPSVTLLSPRERLKNWLEAVRHKLSDEDIDDFKAILDDLED